MTPQPASPRPAPTGRKIAVADIAARVAPLHARAPDDGVPRVSGGQPLAALPEAGIVPTCPDCGSTALRVFYSKRRVCQVRTYADGPRALAKRHG